MADDPLIDVDDDADPDDLVAVQRALAGLGFLRPDAAPAGEPTAPTDMAEPAEPAEPMPDWAWARITSALAAEQESARHRPSRLVRWGGGLVAASVAVLAVGIGVTAFQDTGGSDGAVVANAPLLDATAESKAGAPMAAASAAAESAATAADAPLADAATARELSFASMVPPVFRLVDSDTSYTAAGLKDQVQDVMSTNGMPVSGTGVDQALAQEPEQTMMSDVPADGFTRSAESLRDCVTKMTREEGSTALLVDRSTFEGVAAGVIVAPEPATPPADELEVMVVDPECDLIMKVWIALTR